MEALAVVGGIVVVATVLGLVLRRSSGRARAGRGVPDAAGLELGTDATLLQFSSAVCAPCRATSRVLGELARESAGVAHVEVDVAERPDLTSRFGVLQTPTTIVLDRAGAPTWRIGGAPRPGEARDALRRTLEGNPA